MLFWDDFDGVNENMELEKSSTYISSYLPLYLYYCLSTDKKIAAPSDLTTFSPRGSVFSLANTHKKRYLIAVRDAKTPDRHLIRVVMQCGEAG